jgi:hypothetical protein
MSARRAFSGSESEFSTDGDESEGEPHHIAQEQVGHKRARRTHNVTHCNHLTIPSQLLLPMFSYVAVMYVSIVRLRLRRYCKRL